MLTSRRDYILRLIDEVGRMLNRALHQRREGRPEAALETVVQSCERLFGLEADKLFQFTPEQHIAMLSEGEPPEIARDKLLLYAALNAEAGRIYGLMGKRSMARGSALNALRLCLRARLDYATTDLPLYAPDIAELRTALADEPLDTATSELLSAANL